MEALGDVQAERQREEPPIAEDLERPLGGLSLEDPEVLPQQLGERPVGDPLPVGKAAAGAAQRLGFFVREPVPELAHEATLADTRVAEDGDQPGSPLLRGRAIGVEQAPQLGVAADERAPQAADPTRTHQGQPAQKPAATHSARLALRLDRLAFGELERAPGSGDGPLSDEDLSRLGALLQPRGNVDRIAGHERAALARLPDDDLAGVDPDAKLQPLVQLTHPPQHRQRRVQRPLGVVLERGGRAERGHHRIARELLDGAAGVLDLLGHRVVEAVQERARPLRVLRVAELSRADEIREQHRCELSLLDRLRHVLIVPQLPRAVTSLM